MLRKFLFITISSVCLSSCSQIASVLTALANDKATACITEKITGPGWVQEITVVRSNSEGQSTSGQQTNGCGVDHNIVTPAAPLSMPVIK